MCALDSLWCQIKRQTSWILNLHTVIINSNARSQIILLQLPMAKGIRQSLTQGLSRNFKMFLLLEPHYLATLRKVFKQERHTSIQQIEEIAIRPTTVHELILIRAAKTSQPQRHLRIATQILAKQSHCTVQHLPVTHQIPLAQ